MQQRITTGLNSSWVCFVLFRAIVIVRIYVIIVLSRSLEAYRKLFFGRYVNLNDNIATTTKKTEATRKHLKPKKHTSLREYPFV